MKKAGRSRCEWRETSLMLELLRRAVVPCLSLQTAMGQWADVSVQLAEPRRKRIRQLDRLAVLLS